MRIAAVGDTHCDKDSKGRLAPLFAELRDKADVLVLCGDLTDYGLPEEAQVLAEELRALQSIPVVGVLGNHDFESGHADQVRQILLNGGVKMLDGESTEIQGVGFAGVKGFGGGFDDRMLQPWGERSIKEFVQEGVRESLKLESALAKLKMPQKVAVMHYAPVRATVIGEPIEIFAYLGTSRLEEPLARHNTTLVFHGHAHHGTIEGRIQNKIPVYNVAMPLLARTYKDQLPILIVDLPVSKPAPAEHQSAYAH